MLSARLQYLRCWFLALPKVCSFLCAICCGFCFLSAKTRMLLGLFEETSPFQPFSPQKTVFTQTQDDLKAIYTDLPASVIPSLAVEIRQENTSLQDIVTKTRLDVWFETLLSEAKSAAEEEAQLTALDDSTVQREGEGDSILQVEDADEDMMDAD